MCCGAGGPPASRPKIHDTGVDGPQNNKISRKRRPAGCGELGFGRRGTDLPSAEAGRKAGVCRDGCWRTRDGDENVTVAGGRRPLPEPPRVWPSRRVPLPRPARCPKGPSDGERGPRLPLPKLLQEHPAPEGQIFPVGTSLAGLVSLCFHAGHRRLFRGDGRRGEGPGRAQATVPPSLPVAGSPDAPSTRYLWKRSTAAEPTRAPPGTAPSLRPSPRAQGRAWVLLRPADSFLISLLRVF